MRTAPGPTPQHPGLRTSAPSVVCYLEAAECDDGAGPLAEPLDLKCSTCSGLATSASGPSFQKRLAAAEPLELTPITRIPFRPMLSLLVPFASMAPIFRLLCPATDGMSLNSS